MLFSINKLKSIVGDSIDAFLLFVYPPYCAYCCIYLAMRTTLCSDCLVLIQPIVSTQIKITKKYTVKVLSAGVYKEPLRSLILAKCRSDIVVAQQLGQLIWDMTYIKDRKVDYFVPIPLHWSRYAWRGFNQSNEMANILSSNSGCAPVANILRRNKKTVFQSTLKGQGRIENVSDAFALKNIDYSLYSNKHIVLVDDLFTTGATLHAAARELIKFKPASIIAVVAGRVV
ncbi:ComF family protein [Candidatus Dependentiae bacterium]|nr:ComF family protein [Candidatus Dependentiae bacterium]